MSGAEVLISNKKLRQTLFFNENLNKRIISKMKITHCSLLITYKNDGSPKWKSRGGLQNRCENLVGLNPITISNN